MSATSLAGLRVLVVEDEMLVAIFVETILQEAGCEVIGPISRLNHALKAARENQMDAALLDVDLGGEPVFPVADILSERGVPFVFVTGYGGGGLPTRFKDRPVLTKPYRGAAVLAVLSTLGSLGPS
jgi:DNA-binding response OmpR family regulator